MEQIIDEACFAKKAVLSIGKTTPYKAVVGQAPNRSIAGLVFIEHDWAHMRKD